MKHRFRNYFAAQAITVICVLGIALPTFAQELEGLEEIIVTAERRESTLQRTAISVVAFTGDRLEELGVLDPQTLADFTPNVSIGDGTGRGSGGSMISIRGVNEARISPVLDPAVGIYIDDVYYGRPQTAFLRLLDVERIEVLRGPQGTLFGKNSVGGALRYITKKPNFDGVNGYVKASAGDYDRANLKVGINVPFGETTAMRLSAATLNRDGYVERLSDGVNLGDENTKFAQGQFRFEPNESFNLNFRVDYTKRETDDGPNKVIDYYRFNNDLDTTPGGPTAASPGSSASAAWNGYWGGTDRVYNPGVPTSLYEVQGNGRLSSLESESVGAGLDLTWNISDTFSIKSITGYRSVEEYTLRDPDDQASAYTFFDDEVEEGVDFWSQEFQLNGVVANGALNWVGGVYYSSEEPYRYDIEDRDSRVHLRRGMLILNDTANQETESLGVYLHGIWDVTDKLGITAGIRYTEDDKTYSISQVAKWDSALAAEAVNAGLTPLAPPIYDGCDPSVSESCVSVDTLTGGEKFDSTTPRLAIQYQFTDDVMAYISSSKGFKSGGTNDSVRDIDTPFDPEEMWTHELGLRTEFAEGRARVNATYYMSDYRDKQITVTTAEECVNRCTTNVGDAEISGIEIDAVWLVTESFLLRGGLGTIDAKWTDIQNPAAGVTELSKFGRAPELSYTIGAQYSWDFSGGSIIQATADYAYTDDQNTSPQDSTTIFIQEYSLLKLRLMYKASSGNWDASVFCSNCTDEEYYTGGASWAGASDNTPFAEVKPASSYIYTENGANPYGQAPPGTTFINIGAPRMWGIEFRYFFGT